MKRTLYENEETLNKELQNFKSSFTLGIVNNNEYGSYRTIGENNK
jgi:hypothetical protein